MNPYEFGASLAIQDLSKLAAAKKKKKKKKKKDEEDCATPGEKIRSKGKGRGLAKGKGKGPVGLPAFLN